MSRPKVSGFNASGEAFAAIEDECGGPILAWQEAKTGIVAFLVGSATQPRNVYALSAVSFAGGTAFQYVYLPPEGEGTRAVFVTRFDDEGRRALVTR